MVRERKVTWFGALGRRGSYDLCKRIEGVGREQGDRGGRKGKEERRANAGRRRGKGKKGRRGKGKRE